MGSRVYDASRKTEDGKRKTKERTEIVLLVYRLPLTVSRPLNLSTNTGITSP